MTGRRVLAGALLSTILLGAPLAAPAADSAGRTMVVGAGTTACALVQSGGTLTLESMHWFTGYLTAVNDLLPETYNITGGTNAWVAWITRYCALNPMHMLRDATLAYVQVAYPARLTTRPDTMLPPPPTPAPTPARKQPLRSRPERY